MIKKLIFIIAFLLLFSINALAEEENSAKEFYNNQYKNSGADELDSALPQQTREFLNQNGITPEDSEFVNRLTVENVFSHIWSFIRSGAKTPLVSGTGILAIALLSAAIGSMDAWGGSSATVKYATALSAAALISAPALSVISACINAMKGCSTFMLSFVPIYAVVVASSGGALTAVSMSTLLLTAAQAISYISSFVVVPLLGGYMAISFASAVSPIVSQSGIAEGIKKISFWIMSLMTTIFVGILSIQTAVNASADTLSLKTAKFIVGSAVPVAGTALSEALTTVTASMGLLRSSVGVYGVIACCAIFLPLLAELLIWRIMLTVTSSVSDLFSAGELSSLLRSVDTVMSVMTGIILLTCAMFVISLSVTLTSGKVQ